MPPQCFENCLVKFSIKLCLGLAAGVAERFVKNLGQSEQADCSAVQLLSAKFVYNRTWREIQTPKIYLLGYMP